MVRIFFRLPVSGAVDSRSRVLTCLPCTGAHAACGTTHVLRLCHHRGGECRAPLGSPLRPSHDAGPSYRPMQRDGGAWVARQRGSVSGEGQQPFLGATRAAWEGARVDVQATPRALGSQASGYLLGLPTDAV